MQHRAVSLGCRESHREPAARLGTTEEHIGQSRAEGLSGQPGEQDGCRPRGPWHRNRHPRVHDDDGVAVDRRDLGDELILTTRQSERRPVETFTLGQLRRTDDDNRDVGCAS
ncbi:MAG TPA: hypothetical protein VNW50_12110, partial [Streptosporangiaceae bacterium]|nr:hypothetical protein [Streptosporangiaceae bacterium]